MASIAIRWMNFGTFPHFEKMLYDQAQLAVSYTEACQITHDVFFAEHRARYARLCPARHDGARTAASFSAEDADSLLAHGKPEHAEGAFYVWTRRRDPASAWRGRTRAFSIAHYGVEAKSGTRRRAADPARRIQWERTSSSQRQSLSRTARSLST